MENIGDYGYLIFLLIIFLLRTFFGKKKPAGKAPDPTRRSLEDILGELLGEEQQPTPQPQQTAPPVRREVTSPPTAPAAQVINTEAEPVNEYMRYLKERNTTRGTIQDVAPLEVVSLEEPQEQVETFDLRQAVINQVILERKYT